MISNKNLVRKFVLFLTIIIFLFVITDSPKRLKQFKSPEEILTPSLFVNQQSARFHPLLQQGTFRPLTDKQVENLTAYIAVNAESGEVYTAKNATDKVAPASLTKLMTTMVGLDVASPSARLIATQRAVIQEPTVLGVKLGESFTLEELIHASIATSANDAATIIGEQILLNYGGNELVFIALMNKKAQLLGLGKTNFTNTQGFDDPNQYTNAYDLVRLVHYAYDNYPLIRKAAANQYSTIEETTTHGFYHLPNWNALLGTYPGVDGIKIGYTQEANHVTAVTAKRNGTSVIVIVLGAESIINRDLAAATLLNYAFEQQGLKGITSAKALIAPRLEEWKELREKILRELELLPDN